MNTTNRTSRLIQGMAFIACYCQITHRAQAGALGSDLDRRYDQNTYLAAHHAFANVEEYYTPLTANQIPGIAHQLDSGVRCLIFEIWFMQERVESVVGVPAYVNSQIYKSRGAYTNSTWTASPHVALAHEPEQLYGGYSLLDGYPLFLRSYQLFVDSLKQVKQWMDNHTNEVITLILESHVPEPEFMDSAFGEAGLDNMLFLPNFPNPRILNAGGARWNVPVDGWPQLRRMVQTNQRLVVFSSNGVRWKRYSGQPVGGAATTDDDGQPYKWDFMVENRYGEGALTPEGVGSARASSKSLNDMLYPLTFMNWFPDFPSTSQADVLNDYFALSKARDSFAAAAGGRYPNFISLDHCLNGLYGPQQTVIDCNFHW